MTSKVVLPASSTGNFCILNSGEIISLKRNWGEGRVMCTPPVRQQMGTVAGHCKNLNYLKISILIITKVKFQKLPYALLWKQKGIIWTRRLELIILFFNWPAQLSLYTTKWRFLVDNLSEFIAFKMQEAISLPPRPLTPSCHTHIIE